MGECSYYMKLKFKDAQRARKALPKINSWVHEGIEAEHFWQNRRNDEGGHQFWKDFEQKFPPITTYLKFGKLFGGDHDDELAGELAFGEDPNVERHDDEIWIASYVWHLASWDGFLAYLMKTYQAIAGKWISEEEVNYFDCIQL